MFFLHFSLKIQILQISLTDAGCSERSTLTATFQQMWQLLQPHRLTPSKTPTDQTFHLLLHSGKTGTQRFAMKMSADSIDSQQWIQHIVKSHLCLIGVTVNVEHNRM